MRVASIADIQLAERSLIASGVSGDSLMEDVGRRIAVIIQSEFPQPGKCIAYLGFGNNAGDALVVLRYLREKGWRIGLRCCSTDVNSWSELGQLQWERLGAPEEIIEAEMEDGGEDQGCVGPIVLLDGLVGLGAWGALRSPVDILAREMNRRRAEGRCTTISIDFPSGIDGDTGEIYKDAVIADISMVIGGVKKGMLMDEATAYVGRIMTLPLRGLCVEGASEVVDTSYYSAMLGRRPYEWYKGSAGRVAVVAGSPGMLGAACLCAEAALRAGAGMVSLYALPDVYPLLAVKVSPEIMVRRISSYREVDLSSCDVLLAGPGLGDMETGIGDDLMSLLSDAAEKSLPVVLDADALNLCAKRGALSPFGEKMILTPHIGEMQRLLPRKETESRKEWAKRFLSDSPAVLLLKGARTLIAQRGELLRYNSSGGPAMATAGQGDVLAGACAGLCAQGLSSYDAASLGAWLCGRASELALAYGEQSEQSLTAGDTLKNLGKAYYSLFVNGF